MKRKIIVAILLLITLAIGYLAYIKFFKESVNVNSLNIIPSDAIFIIESKEPIKAWKNISKSPIWNYLIGHPTFKEIGESAKSIDSLVVNNSQIFEYFGAREVYISAHKTKPKDYDFLYIVDLEGAAKIDFLQPILDQVFSLSGWLKNSHQHSKNIVSDMLDKETGEVLHYTLIGNQLVLSYTQKLVENAIETSENPVWMNNEKFKNILDRTPESGLFKLFINSNYFDDWMRCYQEPLDPFSKDISDITRFIGSTFKIEDDGFVINGYMNINDSLNSYLKAMLSNGTGSIQAAKVISSDVSMYTSLGFNNFLKFYDDFELMMKADSAKYIAFQKNYKLVEKLLKIDIRDHLLSWIGDEVAYVMLQPHDSVSVKDYAMFIKTRDLELCKSKLKYIQKKLKRRTPFKIRQQDYKEYQISGLVTKGLFDILFGKLFGKFEKPYYTFIDDYIVFSNQELTLHKLIDDFEDKKTLEEFEPYTKLSKQFSKDANVYTYINTHSLIPLTRENVSPASFQSLNNNKVFFEAFDYNAFQLKGLGNYFEITMNSHFNNPNNSDTTNKDETISQLATAIDSLAQTDSILPEVDIENHMEKSYTADKKLIYSKEIDDDKLAHGKFIEYWPNGELKTKGQYEHGEKKGIWKYYDEQGKFLKKEEMDNL